MHRDTYTSELRSDTCDRLISFASAREMVGVSRSQVYKLLDADAFPKPAKVGRSNFFSEHEIQNWIKARLEARSNTSERV